MPSITSDGRRMMPRRSLSPAVSLEAEDIDDVAGLAMSHSDVSQAEFLVLPYLMHLAASRNDVEGVQYCFDAVSAAEQSADLPTNAAVPNVHSFMVGVGGGIVNALDPCGRAPLHTAALHGSQDCVQILLSGGASVHLRDSLDHTPLYYVRALVILVLAYSHFVYRPSVSGLMASYNC